MPLLSLNAQIPALSVVGVVENSTITHVAILKSEIRPLPGHSYPVWHTGPPTGKFKIPINISAHISDLSNDEAALLKSDIARLLKQVPRITPTTDDNEKKRQLLSHYTVIPPIRSVRDEVDGTFRYFRFSCAGFVAHCYKQSLDVQLVDLTSLPKASKAEIEQAYGNSLSDLTSEEVEELGLNQRRRQTINGLGWKTTIDEEPTGWPILLPGYLIKALDRDDGEIRTTPLVPTSSADSRI